MRTCGAEKLPWLVVEVEVDAERAGCVAERQVRLGLGVDEAIPETCDRLGGPAERTKARLRVRIGAVHEGVDLGGSALIIRNTHLNPRGRGVPQERNSDRLSWVNHRERLPALSSQKRCFRYHIPIPRAGFMTTAYRQPTELGVHCLWSRFMPNRFAAFVANSISMAVLAGRRPSSYWANPLVHAPHRENSNNSFRTATASKSESARGSARNRPRAHSQTGISTGHDQVACRKAREQSRVVIEPGAVVIATRRDCYTATAPRHAAGDCTSRAGQDETDEETGTRKARRNSRKESCQRAHTNRANNRRTDAKNH